MAFQDQEAASSVMNAFMNYGPPLIMEKPCNR